MDKWAKQCVLFEDATSQAHFTLMSFASLFTSRYPESIGTFERGKDKPRDVALLRRLAGGGPAGREACRYQAV